MKSLSLLFIGLLSFSVFASGAPSEHFNPNKNDPAYVAQDKSQPIEQRIDALESLRITPSQNALIAIARALKEDNERIQHAAIVGSDGLALDYRWELISPFLGDTSPTLSYAATYSLAKMYQKLTTSMRHKLDLYIPKLEQYYKSKHDAFSTFKLAEVYQASGDTKKAITTYKSLIEEDSSNQAFWVGLSESYRADSHTDKALDVLNEGILLNPNASQLYYARALARVRNDNKREALSDFKSAAILAETNSYYWYLYALAQKGFDLEKSVPLFEHAYQLSGSAEQLYTLCSVYIESNNTAAKSCLNELKPRVPQANYDALQYELLHKTKR